MFAQYEKISSCGVSISHADSHHHIHTSPSLWFVIPEVLKELGIKRCRRLRNIGTSGAGYFIRQIWTIPYKYQGIRLTDLFGDAADFLKCPDYFQGSIIELECHPAHHGEKYCEEMKLIHEMNANELGIQLINYNDIL